MHKVVKKQLSPYSRNTRREGRVIGSLDYTKERIALSVVCRQGEYIIKTLFLNEIGAFLGYPSYVGGVGIHLLLEIFL